MHTALLTSPIYLNHFTGEKHPEKPERVTVIEGAITDLALIKISPRRATVDDLLLAHSKEWIKQADLEIREGNKMFTTGDTTLCPETYEVALWAAGGVLTAVDTVVNRLAKNAFCLIRPPGHHATTNEGMGYCVFNNVAIGARYAQEKFGIEKVAIIDWDVHHGNGTQEIFYEDPSVFFFSTHQEGIYPKTGLREETGRGQGVGTTMNFPIKKGPHAREEILRAFEVDLVQAMEAFKPNLIMISCGFDAHKDDLLGELNLTEQDFGRLTQIVKAIAEKHAEGRIVSCLEGGYNLEAIAKSAREHVLELMK